MKLIHYADKEFILEPRDYVGLQFRSKPNGLWVSVEGPYDWKWWYESEDFHPEKYIISYEVTLKKDASILYLRTEEEIFTLIDNYPWNSQREYTDTYEIHWEKVKEKYQGIIIAPYQWECRLDLKCSWYYGWDCASGCIWDLDCIEEFKLREKQ